ncbi:MAG: ribokinase, partial [Alphaproteobacteria bacterium]
MQVLVAGALHLDIIVDAPHLPRRDETVTGSAVAYRMGGKGGNQAVAAARMGAVTAMAGRVGRDGFGARILEALDAAGVDRSRVVAGDGPTGISVAIVEATGEYGAVIVSGVNGTVRADDIELPAGLRVLMLQNEIPEAVNLALARRAAPGTLLVLNAAPARPVARELLARTDVLVVNRIEAAQMTGAAPALPDPAAAARLLRGLGPKAVIVTLGADGLLAATPDGMFT